MLNALWATTWQNQQYGCAPSEDSDQPGHPPSLIRVFAVRMKKAWVLSYPLSAQRRLGSDWADAAHSFCWFCHVVPLMFPVLYRLCYRNHVKKVCGLSNVFNSNFIVKSLFFFYEMCCQQNICTRMQFVCGQYQTEGCWTLVSLIFGNMLSGISSSPEPLGSLVSL